MDMWPHQESGCDGVVGAIHNGCRRVLLTSPTGMGKSRMVCWLIDYYTRQGWHAVLYSNRKLLTKQLQKTLAAAGIPCGVRAAGHPDERDKPVQISSIATEIQRVGDKIGDWTIHGLHQRCLAILDEAHCQTGEQARAIFDRHHAAGHILLGVTATPIDLGGIYDRLIVAGNTSAGRKCGALVKAIHYGPDEPDLRALKGLREGADISEQQQRKVLNQALLWGRVLPWFEKLNPAHHPTILFATGVKESLWFAQQFEARGIPAAHIDGDNVWFGGKFYQSTPLVRQEVLDASREKRIVVLCNRFVLREGIDCPWLAHGIFATIFGSLQTYLQAGGRLLRAHPGISAVTVQDHGGNWHRHGSLNADRAWALDDTAASVVGKRTDRLRAKKESEPYRCPKCAQIVMTRTCPCGYESQMRSRPVAQVDGSLKEVAGDIYPPRKIAKFQGAEAKWCVMYFRSKSMKKDPRTFRAAFGLYARENWGLYPQIGWRFTPKNEADQYRLVKDVPMERLHGS
jgi:DNA repair protein RadD